jgi:L-fuculose-phosphate aldolase
VRPDERRLREDVARASNALHAMGWVANHDGNVTARLAPDRYLATPTSVSKASITPGMLIVVDGRGQLVRGELKPFSEFVLHAAAYEARPDVEAVVHAHAPHATAFAVAGLGLERPILAEAVVSLGPRVPLAPYALPGTDGFTAPVGELLRTYDAILLQNHGVLTVGADVEQAYLRMELVEHLARIECHARALGGPRYLSASDVAALLEKRAKAGLGPRVRGLPEAPLEGEAVGAGDAESLLRQIVAEELRATFGGGGGKR